MTPVAIRIIEAVAAGDHRIGLRFDDGTSRVVDFGPFLTRARHPDLHKFLEPGVFATFRVQDGDLVWGDFAMCFPIMELYCGRVG